jgi:hypothetical protein
MRRPVAIFLLACAWTMAAAPAARAGGVTAVGAKAGASVANIFGEDVFDQGFKLGGALGAFLTYSLGDRFAVQPEILFVMKGSRYRSTRFGAYEETMDFRYLEIPVLAKFLLNRGRVVFDAFAGPALAFKLGAKVKYRWEGLAEEHDMEDMKGADLGLAVGAGAAYPLGRSGRLSLDVRYTFGLTSIDANGDGVKNGAFLVLVGWAF